MLPLYQKAMPRQKSCRGFLLQKNIFKKSTHKVSKFRLCAYIYIIVNGTGPWVKPTKIMNFEQHLQERLTAIKNRQSMPEAPEGFSSWVKATRLETERADNLKRVSNLQSASAFIDLGREQILSNVEILDTGNEFVAVSSNSHFSGMIPSPQHIVGRWPFEVKKVITRKGSAELHAIGRIVKA